MIDWLIDWQRQWYIHMCINICMFHIHMNFKIYFVWVFHVFCRLIVWYLSTILNTSDIITYNINLSQFSLFLFFKLLKLFSMPQLPPLKKVYFKKIYIFHLSVFLKYIQCFFRSFLQITTYFQQNLICSFHLLVPFLL